MSVLSLFRPRTPVGPSTVSIAIFLREMPMTSSARSLMLIISSGPMFTDGVRQVQGVAGKGLVQEPGAAREGARGLAGDPGFEVPGRDPPQRSDHDR